MREILDQMWNYRARWRFIGIQLGIDTGTLDAIEADHRKVEDCLSKLINVWLRDVSPRPTRSAMKAALQSERVLSGAGNHVHGIIIIMVFCHMQQLYQISISVMELFNSGSTHISMDI